MKDLLLEALDYYGVREIVGGNHNPTILEFFQEIGHGWVKNDEMAWCSAFVNFVAKKLGYQYTGKLNARSWLEIGEKLEYPEQGCIVVLHRKGIKSIYGHVGIFVRAEPGYIWILGGNQNNEVNITRYNEHRLLEYRKLNKNATKNS